MRLFGERKIVFGNGSRNQKSITRVPGMIRQTSSLFVMTTFALLSACSGDSPSVAAPSPSDAGTEAAADSGTDAAGDVGASSEAAAETAPATANDLGTVLDYTSQQPVAGMLVSEGDTLSATTDSTGRYTIAVPVGAPFSRVVTGPKYTRTWFAERSLAADFDQTASVPLLSLFQLGTGALPGYDATRGIVYILVQPTGSCASVEGGTITVNAPDDTKQAYFSGLLPSQTQKAFAKPGKPLNPVAVVYNVPPGAQLDLTVIHPTCTAVPFPAVVGDVTYTGHVTVEAGNANSVAFYFLK